MSLLFADTHNVVVILEKSDAAEGFEQIIDFLSGSYIHYALTVSPHIYISCIKQFWNSISVKRSGDVTSTAMASAVIYLSKGQRFNFSKYIFDSLVRNVDSSSKFYMYSCFIQLIIQAQVGNLSTHTTRFISPALTQKVFANMRRVRKGFSGVETPLFEGMITDRQPAEEELGAEQVQVDVVVAAAVVEDVAEDISHMATPSPLPHGIPSPLQEPSSPPQQPHVTPSAPTQGEAFPATFQQIVKLKARVKKLEKTDKIKSLKFRRLRKFGASRQVESSNDMQDVFNHGRMMNEDEGIELEDDLEVQEVVEVVTTTKLITKVVTAAATQGSAASATIPAVSATIPAAAPTVVAAYTRRRKGVIIRDPEEELSLKNSAETPAETPKVKDKGKGIIVEAPTPMKKKDQIEIDAEYARKLQEEIDKDHDRFNKDVNWDAAMDHVNQNSSNPQCIKRYQGMKKRPQTESEARKNMMIYLKNTAGYKIDFFKGMTYAQICPIFQARFDENIRKKLSKEAQEAEDLRKRLEVVEDEDDDVFVKATPLASKVPVMDYQIVLIDNKPRYPLLRFTLEQLVNVIRLQVEEESEISLELLRFTRQIQSRKGTVENSFTLTSIEAVDNVQIVLSCNGLLLCTGSGAIYLNGALHWLKLNDMMDGLMHFKLNIKGHDHPILTSIKFHQGLHQGREFTIYEMRKGCSVWSIRYLVNTNDFMNPLLEGWSIWSIVWSIVLGEREDDASLVTNLSGKVVQYNLISKTLHEIYDIGSNQLDDNLVNDELIMPFRADHSVYEFIPSSTSV
nr:hypothetical protein [Tanacetum cinerariifolium]